MDFEPAGFASATARRAVSPPHRRRERSELPRDQGSGAPGRIRTPDPQIRSLVLYPAELPVQAVCRGEPRRGAEPSRDFRRWQEAASGKRT